MLNAKGSGQWGCQAGKRWSWTVDAEIHTFQKIDWERFAGLAYLCNEFASWLEVDGGFHNTTYDTMGGEVDAPITKGMSEKIGFYYVNLSVEDVVVSRGDYRSRRDIDAINAKMLDESRSHGSYSYPCGTVKPRLAYEVRMHVSRTIRAAIKASLAHLVGG